MAIKNRSPKPKKRVINISSPSKGSTKRVKNRGGGAGALNSVGKLIFRDINGRIVPLGQKDKKKK
jgi:hypothetical protein